MLARRLTAYAFDCLLLFFALLVAQAALYPVNPLVAAFRAGEPIDPGQFHLWVSVTTTAPFLLYFASMFASKRQGTFAMSLLGLRVVDEAGRRIGIGRAFVRAVVLLVPFELNHTVMFHLTPGPGQQPGPLVWAGFAAVWGLIALYVVSVARSPNGQGIHDRIAGTVVTVSN